MPNPYVVTTWVDNTTAITAARLNNMETGISDASVQAYAAIAKPASPATTQVLAYNGTIWTGLAVANTHVSASANIAVTKLALGAADTVLQSDGVTNAFATTTGANARVAVGKNSAATTGTRRKLNLIEGSNITLTVADNPGAERVDVTITGASAPQGVPSGAIMDFAGTVAPTGWLFCNGASLLRSGAGYDALFAAIGTTYGAADGTHFNIPDTLGRMTVGAGTHTDVQNPGQNEGIVFANAGQRRPFHSHGTGTLNITSSGTHGHTFSGTTDQLTLTESQGHVHYLGSAIGSIGGWTATSTASGGAHHHVLPRGAGSTTGGVGGGAAWDYNGPGPNTADAFVSFIASEFSGFTSGAHQTHTHKYTAAGTITSPSASDKHVHANADFAGAVGTTTLAPAEAPAYIVFNKIIKI